VNRRLRREEGEPGLPRLFFSGAWQGCARVRRGASTIVRRAWKGHDWEALNRLHEKGFIGNPVGKAKSVFVTEEGAKRSEELFRQFFGK
jgi:hypothetical protein